MLKGHLKLPKDSSQISETPKPKKARKKISRRSNGCPPEVKAIMQCPERHKRRMEGLRKWREANPTLVGRQKGQQDGVRRKDYLKRLEQAKITSERAIKAMEDKNIWKADNDVATKAMKAAIEVMESQSGTTDAKLKAAKLILDFTQTKPVVNSVTTLKSAEDFLSALLEDDNKE